MTRLYKKSVIASGGIHVLLAVVLLVCPAFLASSPKQSDIQPITFYPDILTDSNFSGGGDPNAGQVKAAQPSPPQPPVRATPAPPPPEPTPKVKEVVPPKPAEEPSEQATEPKPTRRKIEVPTKAVSRKSLTKPAAKDTSEEDARAREEQELKSRLAKAFGNAAGNIGSGTATAGTVIGSRGPGGGGASYAGYSAYVWSFFDRIWVRPEDATLEDATVEVSVTIASDGRILAKRILKRSGDSAVDSSVQRTLDKVTTVGRPFPEGATDKERTYRIPFNMKSNRGAA
jgi:TonB family protein